MVELNLLWCVWVWLSSVRSYGRGRTLIFRGRDIFQRLSSDLMTDLIVFAMFTGFNINVVLS